MADLAKQRLVVVCGPTASGKTGLGVRLAQRYGGEILSADSMQIYRGLDVGTAKVTPAETQGVAHHIIDICEPEETFSVADYVRLARQEISRLGQAGRLPVLVGGTGLYLSSLLDGVTFTEEKGGGTLRADLERQAEELGEQAMWEKLREIDPVYAAGLDCRNRKRVLRALEIYGQTGVTMTRQKELSLPKEPPYDAAVIGLRFSSRELLYERINARVEAMLAAGILTEAKYVWQNRARFVTAAQAIGYKEFFPYFEGGSTLAECTEHLKQASRQYAKRQMTWFGRRTDIRWITVDESADIFAQACDFVEGREA